MTVVGVHEPEAAAVMASLDLSAQGWGNLGEAASPGDLNQEGPVPVGADVVVLLDAFLDAKAAAALRQLLARLASAGAEGRGLQVL